MRLALANFCLGDLKEDIEMGKNALEVNQLDTKDTKEMLAESYVFCILNKVSLVRQSSIKKN